MGKLKIKNKSAKRRKRLSLVGLRRKFARMYDDSITLPAAVEPPFSSDDIRGGFRLADAMLDELAENGASGREMLLIVTIMFQKIVAANIQQLDTLLKKKDGVETDESPEDPGPDSGEASSADGGVGAPDVDDAQDGGVDGQEGGRSNHDEMEVH